jgi:hypothetical protein
MPSLLVAFLPQVAILAVDALPRRVCDVIFLRVESWVPWIFILDRCMAVIFGVKNFALVHPRVSIHLKEMALVCLS